MAEKRSNKTARVLNLITQQRGEQPKERAEERSADRAATAETSAAKRENEVHSEPDTAQQAESKPVRKRTVKAQPQTAVVEREEEDELTETTAEAAPAPAAPTAPAMVAEPAAPPPLVVPIVQTAKDREQALSDDILSGLMSALEAEERAAQPEEEPEPEAVGEDETALAAEIAGSVSGKEKADEDEEQRRKKIHFIEKEDRAEQMVATPHGEQHVQYINVMQELVEQNEPYYLTMLHCNCPRCVADMKALALTNLPSKYVVIDQDKKSIMMSFYAARYESVLPIQLMRACIIVNENPHH